MSLIVFWKPDSFKTGKEMRFVMVVEAERLSNVFLPVRIYVKGSLNAA